MDFCTSALFAPLHSKILCCEIYLPVFGEKWEKMSRIDIRHIIKQKKNDESKVIYSKSVHYHKAAQTDIVYPQ